MFMASEMKEGNMWIKDWWKNWLAKFSDFWYWLKCALWHRYNVVKIKTLPLTWNDRTEVLLHANFQILVDFIEQEKPFEWFDTEDSYHKENWDTIRDLYNWWTIERPARKDPYEIDIHVEFDEFLDYINTRTGSPEVVEYYKKIKQAGEQDDMYHAEDDEMLHRLIEVRGHLWT